MARAREAGAAGGCRELGRSSQPAFGRTKELRLRAPAHPGWAPGTRPPSAPTEGWLLGCGTGLGADRGLRQRVCALSSGLALKGGCKGLSTLLLLLVAQLPQEATSEVPPEPAGTPPGLAHLRCLPRAPRYCHPQATGVARRRRWRASSDPSSHSHCPGKWRGSLLRSSAGSILLETPEPASLTLSHSPPTHAAVLTRY